ncbi:hypothetical protein [Emticicia sp.]|uniref:hypothetical protein n=1 Tax=Emticicia sp. TaxID=1930953 RepID=UPI0037536CC7
MHPFIYVLVLVAPIQIRAEVLKEAIAAFGKPEVFNTDQGSHSSGRPISKSQKTTKY